MGMDRHLNEIPENIRKCFSEGLERRLGGEEIAKVLSTLLFEFSKKYLQSLVEVRDYKTVEEKGPFKYSGKLDALYEEGLLPERLYVELKKLGISNHVGPSYVRVKSLLTHELPRKFFGRQLVWYLTETLEEGYDGYLVFLPNMTGGAWIGDEARREAEKILKSYKVWPCTPYVREGEKLVGVAPRKGREITDYVEGLLPPPGETSVVINVEELRTASETTRRACEILRTFGYGEENGVEVIAACVLDYGHPVGRERLKRAGVKSLYLVDGLTFFRVSRKLGYITEEQYESVEDWLKDPVGYTEKILPSIKRLLKSSERL